MEIAFPAKLVVGMEGTAEVVARTTRLNVPCARTAKASTMEKLQEIYIHGVKNT